MSNFDPNAIIRGAQLTLVGGMKSSFDLFFGDGLLTLRIQRIEPSRTLASLRPITIGKLPLQSPQVWSFAFSSPFLFSLSEC